MGVLISGAAGLKLFGEDVMYFGDKLYKPGVKTEEWFDKGLF